MSEFDLFSLPPVDEPPIPMSPRARARHFGDLARQGRLDALAAIEKIEAEFDAHLTAQAAIRDAEVRENRDGRVSRDPASTSAKAATNVAPRSGTQRARVLIDICEHGGATDYELEHRLGMLASAVRPRRGELREQGFVVDSGRVRRHQDSEWTVWSPTQKAVDWYRENAGRAA